MDRSDKSGFTQILNNHKLLNFIDSVRIRQPEEMLKILKELTHKIGITRIANITHLDNFYGIYVSNCIRPNSQNLSISQGKGSSIEIAYISAIMESLEAYHAENPPIHEFAGSYEQYSEKKALINPNILSSNQFEIDLKKIKFNWSTAYNILDNRTFYVPTSLTRLNTCHPDVDYLYFNVSTNGIAAGNSLEEAVFHAICEIIERDSLAKYQQASDKTKDAQMIDINTINDINAKIIDKLRKYKLNLCVWDITSDLGVPSYHAVIMDNQGLRNLNIFTGTGSHLSKSIALFRAITEAIQGRVAYISGVRDDIFMDYYKNMHLNYNTIIFKEQITPQKSYSDCISLAVSNISDNLTAILTILNQYNYENVLLIDHTKPEFNIPVVQVLIPKMLLNNDRM